MALRERLHSFLRRPSSATGVPPAGSRRRPLRGRGLTVVRRLRKFKGEIHVPTSPAGRPRATTGAAVLMGVVERGDQRGRGGPENAGTKPGPPSQTRPPPGRRT